MAYMNNEQVVKTFLAGGAVDLTPSGVSTNPLANKSISQNFSNVLKGIKSGITVSVDDASPLEHDLGVKVESKNKIDIESAFFHSDFEQCLTNLTTDNNTLRFEKNYTSTISAGCSVYAYLEPGIYTFSGISETNGDGNMAYIIYNPDGSQLGGTVTIGKTYQEFKHSVTVSQSGKYTFVMYIGWSAANGSYVSYKNLLLEKGETQTEYTPFVYVEDIAVSKLIDGAEVQSETPLSDGTVEGFTSSPAFELISSEDDGSVLIYLEYNRDINKVSFGGGSGTGKDGKDGFSPIAKVEETTSGAVITITDKDGTTTATVKNGKDGDTYTLTAEDKVEIGKQVSSEIADQDTATQDTAILGAEMITNNGWTLGTGWSGSLSSGFTHASGNTEPLTFTPTITAGKLYQVTFKSSVRMTTTNLFVQVGNSTQFNLYGEDTTNDTGNVSIGVLSTNTSGLVFTPEANFTGTLTNISLKETTGSYEAVQQYFDTNEAVALEMHVTPRGLENVFIGQSTGEMNTTGHENVGIGANVLSRNTSGFWNVGIGKDCLMSNTGGSRNLAIGYNALLNNEVGQRNVALGTFTMTQMKNGNWNIAIGADSMNEATGGNKNVAVGFNTLVHNSGDNNVALGADVLAHNTNGIRNIGIGTAVLAKNTTGDDNVCIGYNSGTAITNANGNVGIGWASLYKTTTGANNVAIGYAAGKSLTTGKYNIVIGAEKEVNATGNYQLNIGDLLKGSVKSDDLYLLVNGGLRLPNIPTSSTGNADEVYAEEWTFTLEDGSTVTKKVLMK